MTNMREFLFFLVLQLHQLKGRDAGEDPGKDGKRK
jgi:hypothetical protein